MARRRQSYAEWVDAVANALYERGIRYEDISRDYLRQEYAGEVSVADAVAAIVADRGDNAQRGRRVRTRGRVCIDRAAHTRRGFTRADGTRVGPSKVARSRFCVRDRGTPGVRSRGAEQGPFRGERPWIQREGELGGPGFAQRSERERRALLRSSVDRFGYRSTLGKLGAILRNSEIRTKTRSTLESDRRWLVRTFGGPGSFGGARNRQLGSGRYEVLTSEGPEARYYDRDQAIRSASGLGRTAMVYDTKSDRIVWQASRGRRRFED